MPGSGALAPGCEAHPGAAAAADAPGALAQAVRLTICCSPAAGPVVAFRGRTPLIYLVCLFASPLALLLIGKPFQFAINLILWLLALVFAITVVLVVPVGVGFWGLGVLHAVLAVNNHRAEKRNRALIDAVKGSRA